MASNTANISALVSPTDSPVLRLRALVERHDDVGPQPLLDLDHAFRCEAVTRTIQVRLEGDPVRVDAPPVREGEDLVAAGVGEDRLPPTHEGMQAAHPLDDICAQTKGGMG